MYKTTFEISVFVDRLRCSYGGSVFGWAFTATPTGRRRFFLDKTGGDLSSGRARARRAFQTPEVEYHQDKSISREYKRVWTESQLVAVAFKVPVVGVAAIRHGGGYVCPAERLMARMYRGAISTDTLFIEKRERY